MKNFAYLKKSSPFYPIFADRGGAVPIINCVFPSIVLCAGVPEDCYMVKIDKLTPQQFARVATLCHARFPDEPFEKCVKEIREHGLPLRASQVDTVSTDCPFWL